MNPRRCHLLASRPWIAAASDHSIRVCHPLPPAMGVRPARHAGDGSNIFEDLRRQSGLSSCSTGWGDFLRAFVFEDAEGRRARARHRAYQARQASRHATSSMWRAVPIHRAATSSLNRLIALGPPRGGLRAARGSAEAKKPRSARAWCGLSVIRVVYARQRITEDTLPQRQGATIICSRSPARARLGRRREPLSPWPGSIFSTGEFRIAERDRREGLLPRSTPGSSPARSSCRTRSTRDPCACPLVCARCPR